MILPYMMYEFCIFLTALLMSSDITQVHNTAWDLDLSITVPVSSMALFVLSMSRISEKHNPHDH